MGTEQLEDFDFHDFQSHVKYEWNDGCLEPVAAAAAHNRAGCAQEVSPWDWIPRLFIPSTCQSHHVLVTSPTLSRHLLPVDSKLTHAKRFGRYMVAGK